VGSDKGFERETTNELLAYIYIARGSAGETRSKLCFMVERPRFVDFKSEIAGGVMLAAVTWLCRVAAEFYDQGPTAFEHQDPAG